MEEGEAVTLLGQGSVNWLSTGTGSSEISDDEFADLTLKKSLEDAGFSVNPEVWNYYSGTGLRLNRGGGGENATWDLNETDWATLEAQCGSSFDQYSDVAVLVVSRIGCEGGDLPRDMSRDGGAEGENYQQLSQTERELLEGAKAAGFRKIVVLLNTCNAMQMDFINDESLGVNACLAIGATGANGLEEVERSSADQLTHLATPWTPMCMTISALPPCRTSATNAISRRTENCWGMTTPSSIMVRVSM